MPDRNKKHVKGAKIKKHIHRLSVSFDTSTHAALQKKCKNFMDEAVYVREATKLCLKKDLINGNSETTGKGD